MDEDGNEWFLDEKDDNSVLSEKVSNIVLDEIIVQNVGDVDGDGKDDFLLQERIVTAQNYFPTDDTDFGQQTEEEVTKPDASIDDNIEYESQNEPWYDENTAPHQFYHNIDDSQEVETPKNIFSPLNIWLWHSRDDIVRDKFEKHIQKIRYDANLLKQRNDVLGYEKKLVEGLTILPNDIELEKQLADLYFHQGKYKKAQSLLKKIIAENPEDHNALRQMWEIATEDKQGNDHAFAYLQEAYQLCQDNPKYAYSLAQWYYDHDDLQSALPLLDKITKLRPKNIDYLVSLSHLQYKIWDREGAINSMRRALELDPMNVTLKQYLKSLQ